MAARSAADFCDREGATACLRITLDVEGGDDGAVLGPRIDLGVLQRRVQEGERIAAPGGIDCRDGNRAALFLLEAVVLGKTLEEQLICPLARRLPGRMPQASA